MKKVYKYLLAADDVSKIQMPYDAKILKIAEQRGRICVWALIDEEKAPESRTFYIVGTGHEIRDPNTLSQGDYRGARLEHLDTVIMLNGDFVFHVFEVVPF